MNRAIRLCAGALAAAAFLLAPAARGEVKMEKVAYLNRPNCYRLSNGSVELIVTTDVGPRVIRYGFIGGENILAEFPEAVVTTELGEWRPLGGHRLWHAPEQMPRTYSPDNDPVEYKIEGGNTIRLTQSVEPKTGIQKVMTVTLMDDGSAQIHHRLLNRGLWPIDLAPWALTIMRGGGVTIIPQEPYRSHDDYLLPARPLVLWHYTDLTDRRWEIGKKYVRLRTIESLPQPQKAGFANKQGWAAYALVGTLFVKTFPYKEGGVYPDYGSNNETYTAGAFMELETLGPMHHLDPGDSAEHVERWYLFKNVELGKTEASLDAAISPIVARLKSK